MTLAARRRTGGGDGKTEVYEQLFICVCYVRLYVYARFYARIR